MTRTLLRIPRTVLSIAGVAAAVAMTTTGCALPGSASADTGGSEGWTLTVGATSVTGTPAGNLGWANKSGILAEELKAAGVTKIEYAFFQSGKDVVAALLSGAVDVAAVGDNPALTAKGSGADIELIALDSINTDIWLIGAKDGPTTIDGLVGKVVTAPQGTIRDRAAHQLVQEAGLEGKIEIKDVPTPESIAGLASGSIDATLVGGTGAVDLKNQGYPVIDTLAEHDLGSVGTNIAQSEFLDKHPGFAQAWQKAIAATNSDALKNLDAYNAWVAETDGVDLALVEEATDPASFNTEALPAVGIDQLESAYDFLAADGSIATEFDLRAWAGENA